MQRNKDWVIREVDNGQAGGAKTGEVPHEQTNVGDKGEDLERQVLCGGVHREAGGEWQDRTPKTDAGGLEGGESGLRGEDKGTQRVDVVNAIETERAHRADRGGIPDNY